MDHVSRLLHTDNLHNRANGRGYYALRTYTTGPMQGGYYTLATFTTAPMQVGY